MNDCTGVRRVRSDLAARSLGCLDVPKDRPELGKHPSKDEQESHRDVIGKFAYQLKFASSVNISFNDVEWKCGS